MKTLDAIVTSHPFLNTMHPEHLELLCKGARVAEYKANERIFCQGEPANRMFLIEEGKVAVEAREGGQTVRVATLGTGDVLGWSWLFPPFSWNFQAVALEPTHVIVLDGGHLLTTAEENHDFGYELMKRVSRIAIERLQTTRKQLIARQEHSLR